MLYEVVKIWKYIEYGLKLSQAFSKTARYVEWNWFCEILALFLLHAPYVVSISLFRCDRNEHERFREKTTLNDASLGPAGLIIFHSFAQRDSNASKFQTRDASTVPKVITEIADIDKRI